jgi:hypothetical protein
MLLPYNIMIAGIPVVLAGVMKKQLTINNGIN